MFAGWNHPGEQQKTQMRDFAFVWLYWNARAGRSVRLLNPAELPLKDGNSAGFVTAESVSGIRLLPSAW